MRVFILSIWSLSDYSTLFTISAHALHSFHVMELNSILRIRLTKYKGRNIVLSDGTQINKTIH